MDKLFSTATSFLGSQSHSSTAPSHEEKPSADAQDSSYGDDFGSGDKAKMSRGQHDGDSGGMDMGELAGTAASLVGAASHYGKLDNTSYGTYAQKAEVYLHDYQAKQGKPSQGYSDDSNPQRGAKSSQGYSEEEEYPNPHQGRNPSQGYSEEEQDYANPRPAGRASREEERDGDYENEGYRRRHG